MENIILIMLLALIIGGAILYILRQKKNGRKCIGCPNGKSCNKSCCDSCGFAKASQGEAE